MNGEVCCRLPCLLRTGELGGVCKVRETGLSVTVGGLRCGDKYRGIVGTQHRKCRRSPHSAGSGGQGPGCLLCSQQGSCRAGAVLSAWIPRLPWKRPRQECSPWKWHSVCHVGWRYPHSSALLQWGMRCGSPVAQSCGIETCGKHTALSPKNEGRPFQAQGTSSQTRRHK